MGGTTSVRTVTGAGSSAGLSADRAFSRMAGAPLSTGNSVRLLRDAAENYPAWIEAIRAARRTIHFETYVLHGDPVGWEFAELLEMKAREGVRVRLIYDWLGALGATSFFFWRRMREAGVQVRCFHPPRPDDPVEWFRRDHRKIVVVDGRVGFVSGLCVGKAWVGDPARGIAPWRDTGVRIEGPAVLSLNRAFARMWNSLGARDTIDPLENAEAAAQPAGSVALRIVSGEPGMSSLYRLDLLVTALARRSMWLTDAYFLATPAYVQSLRAAALDGIDVRLLVPRTSDVPVVRALSRVGYRALLEAGIRIFEWNGSMLHAKTAVVDGRWSRVGSTNLNIASWMSNYELDVVVENAQFAQTMRQMYVEDLKNATEIVLSERMRVGPRELRQRQRRPRGVARRNAGRAATGVLALGSTAGAAITRPRLLGPAEAPIMITVALAFLCLCAVMFLLPRIVAIGGGIGCGWLGVVLLLKAWRLRSARNHGNRATGI